ncbi:Adaptive-response sensory-kinase SasA [subsurface metagenome]
MDVAVTEHTQLKRALQEAREYAEAIIQTVREPLVVLDGDLKIISANRSFYETFDVTPEQTEGQLLYRLGNQQQDIPNLRELLEEILPEKTTFEGFQIEHDFPTIGHRIMLLNARQLQYRDGRPLMTLLAIEDITGRKQIEERQAELLQEVENVNHKLNDFAYIVSHELKAPLRGIRTLVEWIATDYADKLDEKGKEQINLLSDQVVRMHNLIDGILHYSRVEHIREEQTRVDLNKVVQDVIEMLKPPENVVIEVENELPTVLCEQTHIMQVFQNLLSNAVKYMDKPRGQIKVGCVEEDRFLKFSVADNGPGIEEKDFKKIFQIFRTLPAHDKSEGTGIGLSLVKKIVETYGGRVWVESEPASGSTFFFTFPGSLSVVKNDT